MQHIQYREDTLFNVHWWFKHNHALSFTINIVIDSAGTKRICFLLPRSTGKTLNKLHTTKVNIVIMLIDMFMAYGIRWTDEYSQMRWKHTLLLTLNELTLILIMQKGYKMLPASVISALAPPPVSLCGWLVSGPSPGSRCSRSSRCCRDWCRWRGTSGRAWGRSPAPASCCSCAAPSRPHQQASAAVTPAPPGSREQNKTSIWESWVKI